MSVIFLTGLLAVAVLVWQERRTRTYLHLFQQEEYSGSRFVRWVFRRLAFDRTVSAFLLVQTVVILLVPELPQWVNTLSLIAVFLVATGIESDPTTGAKKKLVLTARAKRILDWSAVILTALTLGSLLCFESIWWPILFIGAVQLIPFVLVGVNCALEPVEKSEQAHFLAEAQQLLSEFKPTIIGITGSFGKTSVKHILAHVLEIAAPTLATPGSVNTPMGVTRVIREQLKPHHRFFIVEMGAYGVGSIKRLCQLFSPQFGIITAIGKAHFERFRSLNIVAEAKFELANAVGLNGGRTLCPLDVSQYPAAYPFLHSEAEQSIRLMLPESEPAGASDFRVGECHQEMDGIRVPVILEGIRYDLHAPLFGVHHGTNVALAFFSASMLGVKPELILAALRTCPQITHRLEVKHQPGGWLIIDDAYNSNPQGFASALRLLGTLARPPGRRILITPGMVELGEAHDEEHEKIGKLAAETVNILIVVKPSRVPGLVQSFNSHCPDASRLIECEQFSEAETWIGVNIQPGDCVLLENDLPDLFEAPLKL